jgi:4-amino-4-deoxy-L-arabinose transferase-like glycosyltransferase
MTTTAAIESIGRQSRHTAGAGSVARRSLYLFFASLLIRLVIGSALGLHTKAEGDGLEYYNGAVSIAHEFSYALVPQQSADGQARLTAFRMPGPSLFMAMGFELFGTSVMVARLCSVFAGAFAAPLMYIFARQVVDGPAALVASLICLLHPVWNYAAPDLMSEPYFIPALLLSVLMTIRAFPVQRQGQRDKGRAALLAGLCWGATALLRPQALPLAMLFAAMALWRGNRRTAALLALGTVLSFSPWPIRNYVAFGRLELLETVSGETFLGANNPRVLSDPAMHGMWISPMAFPEYRQRLADVHNDFERRNIQNQIAMRFLIDNLSSLPRLVVYKLWRWLTPVSGVGGITRIVIFVSYGSFLVLLAAGVPLGVYRQSIALQLALLITAAYFLITIVYWGILTRGRLPLEMIWTPWVASTADALWTRAKKRLPG